MFDFNKMNEDILPSQFKNDNEIIVRDNACLQALNLGNIKPADVISTASNTGSWLALTDLSFCRKRLDETCKIDIGYFHIRLNRRV